MNVLLNFIKNIEYKVFFPWNNIGGKTSKCKNCKVIILEGTKTKLCKRCSSFINNSGKPSKPQLEIYEKIKKIYNEAKIEFQILNYRVDISIPSKMIVVEYDGSYWHQDIDYDNKRQKDIESKGWRFLRYRDYVPNMNELENDISKIIKGC